MRTWSVRKTAFAFAAAAALGLAASGTAVTASADETPAGFQQVGISSLDNVQLRQGVDLAAYGAVLIEPVHAELDAQSRRLISTPTAQRNMQNEFEKRLRAEIAQTRAITDMPREGAIVLRVTLTRLVPNNAILHQPGLMEFQRSRGTGGAAFEAKLFDAASGEVIATMASRYTGHSLSTNLRSDTEWGDALHAFDRWSRALARDVLGGHDRTAAIR
jgi:hypothetical protein